MVASENEMCSHYVLFASLKQGLVHLLPKTELLKETLFFGLDHARSAVAEWRYDYNTERPHSSLGYASPAAYAENPHRNRLRRSAR